MGFKRLIQIVFLAVGWVATIVLFILGLMYGGYFIGVNKFTKKDFVQQPYSVYKVIDGGIICKLDIRLDGWVCKSLPSELKGAIDIIFNFDNLELREGSLITDIITHASVIHGLDRHLVMAIVKAESEFNPVAISNRGCIGLMQLCSVPAHDPFNPVSNVYAGVRHFRSLMDYYGGNEELALAAWNAGPGSVSKYGGVPPYLETTSFIRKVFRFRDQFKYGSDGL